MSELREKIRPLIETALTLISTSDGNRKDRGKLADAAATEILALIQKEQGWRVEDERIGSWLSAALDDPNVCDEMKADIEAWMAGRSQKEQGWRGSKAAQDVIAERQRQIEKENWSPEHDDHHEDGALANAAASYALNGRKNALVREYVPVQHDSDAPPPIWPWFDEWWKPKDRRRDLVRAGALIIAEIERLDRAEEINASQP
jgi:hypothetical protein